MLRIYFCLFEKIKVDSGFLTLIYNEYSSKCHATRCHVTLHLKEIGNEVWPYLITISLQPDDMNL